MATRHTVCPLDCPDRCTLDVEVDGEKIVAIEGNHTSPVTHGFICSKVRNYSKRVDGADRVLYPQRRTGRKGEGRFERISWEEALSTVAARLRETADSHGPSSILPFAYGGSNGLVAQGSSDEFFFRRLGASRLERTICAAQTGAASAALYGGMAGVDLPDFAKARFILIWGANPRHSNIHLLPFVKKARDSGARVALVDPRDTLGPGFVDLHLPVLPGTDLAVALAMIGHLDRVSKVDREFLRLNATGAQKLLERAREWTLERAAKCAGVEASTIAAIAEAFADSSPSVVRCGWGVERNRNGEASVAAILALPAVAGKFGPAGGYALSSSEAYRVNAERLAGTASHAKQSVNMTRLGRVLLEEPATVHALFVYDANPAVTLPDQNRVLQGLAREDLFTVVFDQVRTDTAAFADVLLPATTFLEQSDVSTSYGTYGLFLSEPVVSPRGESKPNAEVFSLLSERMGFGRGPSGDALLESAVASVEGPIKGGASLSRLRQSGRLGFEFPGSSPVQFRTSFPGTGDGKIHLWPEEFGEDPYRYREVAETHPLCLISPSSDQSICSTLAEFGFSRVALEMHPEDARGRGLSNGQSVRVFNHLGEVIVPLALSPAMRPGVVALPKGLWRRHVSNGFVSNALVPDEVSEISGGALFNDARVEVRPAP